MVDMIRCNFKVGSLGTNERIGVQFLTDCNQGGPERSKKHKITNHLLGLAHDFCVIILIEPPRPMSEWPGGKCQGIPLGTPVTFTAEVYLRTYCHYHYRSIEDQPVDEGVGVSGFRNTSKVFSTFSRLS